MASRVQSSAATVAAIASRTLGPQVSRGHRSTARLVTSARPANASRLASSDSGHGRNCRRGSCTSGTTFDLDVHGARRRRGSSWTRSPDWRRCSMRLEISWPRSGRLSPPLQESDCSPSAMRPTGSSYHLSASASWPGRECSRGARSGVCGASAKRRSPHLPRIPFRLRSPRAVIVDELLYRSHWLPRGGGCGGGRRAIVRILKS